MLYYVVQLSNLDRMHACFIYSTDIITDFQARSKSWLSLRATLFFVGGIGYRTFPQKNDKPLNSTFTHPTAWPASMIPSLISHFQKSSQFLWTLVLASSISIGIRSMDNDRPTCLSIEYYWYSSIGTCHQYLRPTVVVLLYHLSFIKCHGKS